MAEIGKMLLILGGAIFVVGLVLTLGAKLPYFGKLPGDILIKKENYSFYFPLTTCLLISLIFSIISLIWFRK